jgi:tetratricopeptide (TPR) repeat protein
VGHDRTDGAGNPARGLSGHFTGREAALAAVARGLRARGGEPGIVAVHGLKGTGKTELARKFIHDHGDRHDRTHWVHAPSEGALAKGFAALARELGLRAGASSGPGGARAAVMDRLGSTRGWLLVLDEVAAPSTITGRYLPRQGGGSVLITSDHAGWWQHGTAVDLGPFERSEAVAFLIARLGLAATSQSASLAGAVAEELGDLPLALERAAARVSASGLPLDEYLRRLRADPAERLALVRDRSHDRHRDRNRERNRDRRGGVANGSVWSGALRSLRETAPAAGDLLGLLSFLAPSELEQACLERGVGPAGAAGERNGLALAGHHLHDMVSGLRYHSLVRTAPFGTIAVNGLLQAVVRAGMPDDTRRRLAAAALRLVAASFPVEVERRGNWSSCERLLAHAFSAVGHARALGVELALASELLGRVGWYEWQRGRSDGGVRYLELAVGLAGQAGAGSRELVWLHNRLGLALRWRGQLERAEQALGTAGALNTGPAQDLGELRFTLNALGLVHGDLGSQREAKLAFERSAALMRADLDGQPDGGPTATGLLRRGRRLLEEGSAHAAVSRLNETASITRRAFGADHPERGLCLELLGRALAAQGSTGRACALLRSAYRIDAARYGEHHPRTAADLDAMGVALARVHGPSAMGLLESAIRINRAALGPDSIEVASNLVNLAEALGAGGDPERVKASLVQAHRIFRARLGAEDARTRRVRSWLAMLEPGGSWRLNG